MRLLTWNAARGQFARKAPWVEHFHADIVVIQEVAKPQSDQDGVAWFGANPNQGVAVVVRKPYSVQPLPEIADSPKYFVPFRISGPTEFVLFAVWTLGDQDLRYVRGAVAAIDMYAEVFAKNPVVVLGDFNSNAIWDHEHIADHNHSAMVARLLSRGLVSAFHSFRGIRHGEEREHTFFLHKNPTKGYHIDYCFIPEQWLSSIRHVDIGSYAAWHKASDHCPLLVDVATEA